MHTYARRGRETLPLLAFRFAAFYSSFDVLIEHITLTEQIIQVITTLVDLRLAPFQLQDLVSIDQNAPT